MRSRTLALLSIAASAAACAPAPPPAGPVPTAAPARAEALPIPALLGERERLSLSAEQVAALDSIARDWAAADATLKQALGAGKGRPPNPLKLALRADLRPTRAALAANHGRAVRGVEQVLKPEQRRAACEASAAADGLASGAERRPEARGPWPWCTDATVSRERSGR